MKPDIFFRVFFLAFCIIAAALFLYQETEVHWRECGYPCFPQDPDL